MITYIYRFLLSLFQDVNVDIPVDYATLDTFFGYVESAMYFLPMKTISIVIIAVLSIGGIRIIISLVKLILSLIPLY